MKKIDFENGTVTNHILSAALPMLVAQLLNLLYNIVDRIYIARIPDVGTVAPVSYTHLNETKIYIYSRFAGGADRGGLWNHGVMRFRRERQPWQKQRQHPDRG